MLRGRPAGAQPALPPAPRGRLPSPARRGSGATAAAKLPPRSDTRLAGSPAQRLLRRQQRRCPMRLGRRRPCSRRWCCPDRDRARREEKRAVFFLKYEDPGRLRVDLNPLRTVERKLESKRRKSRAPERLGMDFRGFASSFRSKFETDRDIPRRSGVLDFRFFDFLGSHSITSWEPRHSETFFWLY